MRQQTISSPRTGSLSVRPLVLVVAAIVVVIGGGFLIWYFFPRKIPNFDELGGTILVYEVDSDRHKNVDMEQLVNALKRRADPTGTSGITVRAAGSESRVEIVIPKVGDHIGEVKKIKVLVAQVGRLYFRILANDTDDAQAIKEVQDQINILSNPDQLKAIAKKGLPPPGPLTKSKEPKKFVINLPRGHKSIVTYSWVEIGKQERRSLGFNNEAKNDADPSKRAIWAKMDSARKKSMAIQIAFSNNPLRKLLQGALVYSRAILDANVPEQKRQEKKYEYFVLARNPEFVDGKGNPDATGQQHDVTGEYLIRAYEDSSAGRPQVGFAFSPEGGELFGRLTRKNVPSGGGFDESKVKRHLAILLDGVVMTSPTINSEVRDRGIISGDFTKKEVRNLVTILRSGALPAALKPMPISETTVGPKSGKKP